MLFSDLILKRTMKSQKDKGGILSNKGKGHGRCNSAYRTFQKGQISSRDISLAFLGRQERWIKERQAIPSVTVKEDTGHFTFV